MTFSIRQQLLSYASYQGISWQEQRKKCRLHFLTESLI